MRDWDGGTIVNISAVAARDGTLGIAHYSTSKAGMNNLTWTLGYEWSPHGLRVGDIMPELVSTERVESQLGISVADIDRADAHRQIGAPRRDSHPSTSISPAPPPPTSKVRRLSLRVPTYRQDRVPPVATEVPLTAV